MACCDSRTVSGMPVYIEGDVTPGYNGWYHEPSTVEDIEVFFRSGHKFPEHRLSKEDYERFAEDLLREEAENRWS